MMMMGRDMLLKGELIDRTLTLVGVKSEVTGTMPPEHGTPGHDHDVPPAAAAGSGRSRSSSRCRKTARIAGEMMTTGGPVKWTGEKLRAKKKG